MAPKSHRWYLQGYCLERDAYRIFKISRIGRLEATGRLFTDKLAPPPIEEAVPDGDGVEVRLCFSKELAYRVYGEFDPQSIETAEDGSLLLTAVLLEDQWLYSFLLSFGGGVEVLSPAHVRDKFAAEGKKIYLSNKNMTADVRVMSV